MIRPTSNWDRRRARMAAAVVAVTASVVLAACAGTGNADTSGPAANPEAGTDDTAAFDEYRQCIADNGVDLPDPEDATAPERDPSDTSDGAPGEMPEPDADFETAQEACADLTPPGAMGPGGRPPDDASSRSTSPVSRTMASTSPNPRSRPIPARPRPSLLSPTVNHPKHPGTRSRTSSTTRIPRSPQRSRSARSSSRAPSRRTPATERGDADSAQSGSVT